MPKRTDISRILIIGSGPIVIGQACEFDYSGTQATKALRDEGYEVILINSNPATIMTDPEFSDRTYIEPITPFFLEQVIKKERPDAVLPTMGGQTALNAAIELEERGVLSKYSCELIGAKVESITMAEDRELFRKAMDEIGLESARSALVRSVEEAEKLIDTIGFPMILRPSRTLGGSGGGIVRSKKELVRKVSFALQCSPNHEVLIEESLLGWKEFELELMRDKNDNVAIICSIENLDPMGVHTGDSITVAPIQTLTDKEYQELRDGAIKIMRKIGVDTGGSNVQFALDPESGRIVVIEMNPRVSRSSALASKATGYPIAKIAAKLAVGLTLDEIQNDITRETPASFEPALDYVVVKIPRFTFEKFPLASPELGTQMKSVGEAMAIGRTFPEALQKALCSLEVGSTGFDREAEYDALSGTELAEKAAVPSPGRLWMVAEALRKGVAVQSLYAQTGIDPWFLSHMEEIVQYEESLKPRSLNDLSTGELSDLKQFGFSDKRLASLLQSAEGEVRERRRAVGVVPSYRLVDTCAAEFEAYTPYLYSSFEPGEQEFPPADRKKIMILGSGPNRIGQGIEFDYCCVHAVLALREEGFETIMVNCNPETVSTDYDTADRLYFEPLTEECVLEICRREKPDGVIVQFGGQTPLKLAKALEREGVPIIGTAAESIDIAEDRSLFSQRIVELGLRQPDFALAASVEEARERGGELGFPMVIRPSFVLGGRAMRIVYSPDELETYMVESVEVSEDRPVLMDRFLDNAIEVDVDAVCDGKHTVIAGVMEHIERAGVHSGDSSCCLPPQTLPPDTVTELKRQAALLAESLSVVGLLNVQFAVTPEKEVFVLEANPRASRTVPFVSKATGVPWAKRAAQLMAGIPFSELDVTVERSQDFCAVKGVVFPFKKFQGVDTLLGPEMKSTGEVMGIHPRFAGGFAKAQFAANQLLPREGTIFLSVRDDDKEPLISIAERLKSCGYHLIATSGTAQFLTEKGIETEAVNKVREGSPHIVDLIGEGKVQLVINTPEGEGPHLDSRSIRMVATEMEVPLYTTIAAASAAADALVLLREEKTLEVNALQDYFPRLRPAPSPQASQQNETLRESAAV